MSAPDWTAYVIAYMRQCVIDILHAFLCFYSNDTWQIFVVSEW